MLADSSPFHQDALRPGVLRTVWQILNIPAFAALVIGGPVVAVIVLYIQWFLIGYLGVIGLSRIRNSGESKI